MHTLDFSHIRQAAARLEKIARHTPLLESAALNKKLQGRVLFKPECLQVTGSFKIRGAFTKIAQLSAAQKANGVVAYSSGNHAQGVAAAAHHFALPATLIMPADAPAIKINGVKALGGSVMLYDRQRENREQIGARVAAQTGATLIKPYDDPDVIAGQGTVGLEALTDCRALNLQADAIVCPCGGGGLIAGIATAAAAMSPQTTVWAAEPVGFDDTIRSLASGMRETAVAGAHSICDAIVTPQPGELTLAINRRRLSGGFAVTDEEVIAAIKQAFEHLKLVLEPGAASAFAGILSGKFSVKDKVVIVILSGGNIDLGFFRRITRAT